jgi:hypothetical protein
MLNEAAVMAAVNAAVVPPAMTMSQTACESASGTNASNKAKIIFLRNLTHYF